MLIFFFPVDRFVQAIFPLCITAIINDSGFMWLGGKELLPFLYKFSFCEIRHTIVCCGDGSTGRDLYVMGSPIWWKILVIIVTILEYHMACLAMAKAWVGTERLLVIIIIVLGDHMACLATAKAWMIEMVLERFRIVICVVRAVCPNGVCDGIVLSL